LLLALAGVAVAACPSTSAVLNATLEHAESAFVELDASRLRSDAGDVTREALCLSDRPGRGTIARLHRVVGLAAFIDQDDERARSAFAAAKLIEPEYRFPAELVPDGTPAAELYASASATPAATAPIPAPRDGRVEIDGEPASARATDRPALALIVGADGAVVASAYVWPADPLPSYEVAQPQLAQRPAPGARRGPNRPLLAVAGASLLAAGAVYGANLAVHAGYDDLDPYSPEGQRLRTKNNALVITDAALGVVVIGAGVGAVIAGRW
jgi:hypothetical protein